MAELLSKSLMLSLLNDLTVAFPGRRNDDQLARMAEVYRDALAGLTGDSVRAAVKRAIQEDQFFPKVARLRELAKLWTEYEHRTAPTPLIDASDPLWCPRCQSRAQFLARWRPMVPQLGPNNPDARHWLLSADGQWLLLERYERLLCACAAACRFVAADGVEPPAMRIQDTVIPRSQMTWPCAVVVRAVGQLSQPEGTAA